MAARRKVLFVCTANLCRSVLAERLLNALASKKSAPFEARSCGTSALASLKIPAEVRRRLEAEGVLEPEHVPRRVTTSLLEWADVALTMTEDHARYVREQFPSFKGKVFTLRTYVGLPDSEVADPMGKGESAFASAEKSIREALDRLLEKAAA